MEMYTGNPVPPPNHTGSLTMCKVGILLCELLDDEDDTDSHAEDTPTNTNDPWHEDFNGYLHSRDKLGAMTIVEWWGVWIHLSLYTHYAHGIIAVEFKLVPSLGLPSSRLPSCHGVIHL